MSTKPIQLGNRARCIVTGLTGIVTARIEYLNGCEQLCLRPPLDKDGKEPDVSYIDIGQLEYVDDGITAQITRKETGGPQRDAPRH